MPKLYNGICKQCGVAYRSQNVAFCSHRCKAFWQRINRPRGEKSPAWRGKTKVGICRKCGSQFTYNPTHKSGVFCSTKCYWSDKEYLSEQSKGARKKQLAMGISAQKISDEKLLELWELYKATGKSLSTIFKPLGYKRVPPKRLLNILPPGEYDQYRTKTNHQSGYLYKRGAHYERKAMKALQEEGYMVIKSAGSKGLFDLWAMGHGQLRLVQSKATMRGSNFTKLREALELIEVPEFATKEIWVWEHRKGWKKIIV
jgi:hypothetical protein